MEVEKAQEQFDNNYSEILRKHSTANGILGGEFLFEKMNFIEKYLIQKISGVKTTISKIKTNEINRFIKKINE